MAKDFTISLCLIAKDEERVIGQCLESCAPYVDEVIFVDTGSRDKTLEIARRVCGDILTIIHEPWKSDFSYHRNTSFDAAKGTWIMWVDADDTVTGMDELLKHIAKAGNDFDILNLPYDYARDEFGNVAVVHWRERIIRNVRNPDGTCQFRWRDPIHEYLHYPEGTRMHFFEGARVIHHREMVQDQKPARRNIDILEDTVRKAGGYDKADPRHIVYLGNEYYVRGEMDAAVEAFKAYLERSTWPDEALQVHCKLAMYERDRGNIAQAYAHALEALRLNASWPDPYILMAQLNLNEGKFSNAIALSDIAEKLPAPSTPLILNPLTYRYVPKAIRYKSRLLSGDPEGAVQDLEACKDIRPDEDVLKDYKFVQDELERRKQVEAVVRMAPHLNHWVLDKLDPAVKQEPVIQDIIAMHLNAAPVEQNRKPKIAIYTGPHYETWGPPSLTEGGIGGSETAAVNVARELALRGADVTVYGEPGPYIGDHDGVRYLHARHLTNAPVDLFITSRRPEVLDLEINARSKWIWLHDVNVGPALTPERIQKLDRALALTDWHSVQYRRLYDAAIAEKLTLTSNAIDPALLEKAVKDFSEEGGAKDPYRFIYSSSPDRGLHYILDMWPDIKEVLPKASLHIYYGWNNYDQAARQYPGMVQYKAEILKKLEILKDLDVVQEGRVSQVDLYKAALASGIWMYPTNFGETYCITAKEMLACGVIPIVSAFGGLVETVGEHGYLINGSPEYPEVRQEFIRVVKGVMDDLARHPQAGVERMRDAAKSIPTWGDVAEQWLRMYQEDTERG